MKNTGLKTKVLMVAYFYNCLINKYKDTKRWGK